MLDAWNAKRAGAEAGRVRLSRRIEDPEERPQKLVGAHLYRGGIDESVDRRRDDELAEEIALVRSELHVEGAAEIDVEGVRNLAGVLLLDPRRLWIEGTLDQRQRLQQVLFPAAVTYEPKNGFGTADNRQLLQADVGGPKPERS